MKKKFAVLLPGIVGLSLTMAVSSLTADGFMSSVSRRIALAGGEAGKKEIKKTDQDAPEVTQIVFSGEDGETESQLSLEETTGYHVFFGSETRLQVSLTDKYYMAENVTAPEEEDNQASGEGQAESDSSVSGESQTDSEGRTLNESWTDSEGRTVDESQTDIEGQVVKESWTGGESRTYELAAGGSAEDGLLTEGQAGSESSKSLTEDQAGSESSKSQAGDQDEGNVDPGQESEQETGSSDQQCQGKVSLHFYLLSSDGESQEVSVDAEKVQEEELGIDAEKVQEEELGIDAEKVQKEESGIDAEKAREEDSEKTDETEDSQTRTTYQASLPLPSAFRGRIAIVAEDCCGNQSRMVYTEGLVIEEENQTGEEKASISIETDADGQTDQGEDLYSKEKISFSVQAKDAYAGIAGIYLSVAGGSLTEGLSQELQIPLNEERSIQENTHYQGWDVLSTEENLVTEIAAGMTVEVDPGAEELSLTGYMLDRAGKRTEISPIHVLLDQTPPQVLVSFDQNQAQNKLYYNCPRKADIWVHEKNFRPASTFVLAYGQEGAEAEKSDWEQTGSDEKGIPVYHMTVNFTEDDSYQFHIYCRDGAGNSAGQATYGDGTRNPENFVIDRKLDQLEISGPEEGDVYTGDIHLKVSLYDKNLEDSSIDLSFTNVLGLQEKVLDPLKIRTSEDQKSRTLDLQLNVGESKDGCYCLQVEMKDLAGNSRKKEINFVLNREGSLFWLDSYFYSLNHTYVQSVSQDLIAYERNPSGLAVGGMDVEILRNGMTQKADYQMIENSVAANATTSSLASDEKSTGKEDVGKNTSHLWHSYQYILSKDNFSQDGVYQVSLSSADTAGNISASWQKAGNQVTFCLDSTAPVLRAVTGMEEEKREEGSMTFKAYDTYGMASVKVYVDGKKTLAETEMDQTTDYSGQVKLTEGQHHLRFLMTDLAGNVFDSDAKDSRGNYLWTPSFSFCRDVTVEKEKDSSSIGGISLPFSLPFDFSFSLPFGSGKDDGQTDQTQGFLPGKISVGEVAAVLALAVVMMAFLVWLMGMIRRRQVWERRIEKIGAENKEGRFAMNSKEKETEQEMKQEMK